MISKKEVINFLKEKKFIASKKMGQNFLIDQNIAFKIRKIVKNIEFDYILEIGPGLGAITECIKPLATSNYKAIELDKRLASYLLEKQILLKSEIIIGDALKINWNDLFPKNKKICLIGNLPYSISSPLIFKFIDSNIDTAILMLQLEMSDRITAKINTSNYNAFSVFSQYFLKKHSKNFIVEPNSFFPVPNVKSCVSFFEKKNINEIQNINKNEFKNFLLKCFNQRRKTIFNNLKNNYPKDKLEKVLKNLNIDIHARPQQLKINDFLLLMDSLSLCN
ncbi:16S rRNA (adenine(1518)-N(6)/adenine(1519)-N(6))-dimethyltransferase RsmA [Mycoplasmoides pirum]|uniref:16S rRNA (adenine(1518)-N(6)/adenine(1519)-N(6))- dimethyltransferase RsmA n=1 Tax=Mycoplasmoides pirum TaxID=2122 RepID=UPI0004852766|nr:16S rRNA (adenine(1518)-N(6)/adenine(1519)-N(6))-dimethyltransferase RsmA [Mycoplasmoides pirum]